MDKTGSEVYSRSEKSLSTLTRKFVEMLQSDEILDLNVVSWIECESRLKLSFSLFQACLAMDVSKKRRIYDITNVLEGINLIKKVGKNLYSWTGRKDDNNTLELEELLELKEETKLFEEEEQTLNE